MIRLSHRMASQKWYPLVDDDQVCRDMIPMVRHNFQESIQNPSLIADNIATYLHDNPTQEVRFGSVTPPFVGCIVEYATPWKDDVHFEGAVVTTFDAKEYAVHLTRRMKEERVFHKSAILKPSVADFSKWVLCLAKVSCRKPSARVSVHPSIVTIALREDGTIIDDSLDEGIVREISEVTQGNQDTRNLIWQGEFGISLFALSMANCKNATLEDSPEGQPHRRFVAANKHSAAIDYRVITIATRMAARTATDAAEEEANRRLHVCRGHFATYTPDRPLFGKHTGTFWKPAHMRGEVCVGSVIKDYSV